MVDDRLRQQHIAALEENTRASDRMIDPFYRAATAQGGLASVMRDNIGEVRFLRNTLLQQNNVANKLKDSIIRADSINVKGLGQNITLQKIIDQNSKAINDSSVGYLRAAEAFVDNFAAGIRRTEGGTLRLTEQLILTNQSQEAFRSVNNQLLSESGRNYNALSEFNDAVLETADTYTISTDKLLDGINKLMGDIRQFSLFGPQVADGIAAASTELLGKFQGLNEGQLTSLFRILKPGLEGRATREVLGVQALQEQLATGNIDAAQLESGIMQIAQKIDAFTAGASPDVAFAQLKAIGLSPEDSANFMAMRRTLDAGAEDNKKLQATQKEQLDTIKNQTELANKYYEKIAPTTMNAAVSIIAPIMKTAQLMNVVAAASEARQSLGTLAGLSAGKGKTTIDPKTFTQAGLAHQNVMMQPGMVISRATQNQTRTLGKRFSDSVGNLVNHTKQGFNSLKDVITNPKRLATGPVGLGGIALGGQMLAGQLGEEGIKGTLGKGVGQISEMAGMVSMAQTLIPKLGSLTVGGGIGMAVGGLADTVDELAGFEAGSGGDTVTDIAKFAGYGATIGSIIPGFGTGIGAAVGAAVGGLSELFDFDGDQEIQEAQLKEQREQKRLQERQLRQAERAKIAKSDFVLMGIVERVQRQQAELIRSGNAESVAAMKALTEAVKQGNLDRKSISKDKRGDMNK